MTSKKTRKKLWLKRILVEFLANRGFTIGKCVDANAVKRLIQRLHPVTTEKKLIRLGQSGDGGYLVPDDLDGLVACFSPGVDVKASFEADLIAKGIPCFLIDASVDGPPISDPLVHFDKKFLGVVEDESFITLNKWVETCAPKEGDLILQIDIEGMEWAVMLNAAEEVLARFRIIVIELHDIDRLLDPFAFSVISAALDRILRMFHVVHLHPNNNRAPQPGAGLMMPYYIEMTLLRRDRARPTGYASQFPHPLDQPNVPHQLDFPLPAGWYRSSN